MLTMESNLLESKIKHVNDILKERLPESEEYLTVGGLILHEYQSFPKLNEYKTCFDSSSKYAFWQGGNSFDSY